MIEYFSSLTLSLIFTLSFLIKGTLNKGSIPVKPFFIFYGCLSITQMVFSLLVTRLNFLYLNPTNAIEYSINIFNLIEIILFAYFFIKILKNPISKKIIFFSTLIFVLWILYRWFFEGLFGSVLRSITLIESFLFILFSLFYFSELLKFPTTYSLKYEPKFWIVIGIFLLCSLLFPLFLFKDYINLLAPNFYSSLYTANNIGYAILFYCLTKALQCSIPQHK